MIFIFSLVLVGGCWDMREINDLGFVTAVAVDLAPAPNKYAVTVQIANPSGQGDKAQGGSSSAVWVGTQTGKSLFEAIRNLIRLSSRRVMWAHNNVIMIGEPVARDSIQPIVDFFSHNPELRMKTIMVVAHGAAKPYLLAQSGMETPSGAAFLAFADYTPLLGQSFHSDLITVMEDLSNLYMEPLIAAVSLSKQPATAQGNQQEGSKETEVVDVAGTAVFRKDKMVGWLTPTETRGVAWIVNVIKNIVITVNDPLHHHRAVAVELRGIKKKITMQVVSGTPRVRLKLTGQGSITEEDGPSTNPKLRVVKKQVERLVEQQIAREIHAALLQVQKKYRADVVHFASYMRIQHLRLWEGGFEHQWPKVFPAIPVQVQVKVKLISSVLKQEPAKLQ